MSNSSAITDIKVLAPQPSRSCASKTSDTLPARRIPDWYVWGVAGLLPIVTFWMIPADWPRWGVMWTLCASVFAACKWLTWRRAELPETPWRRQLAYLFAWPGLDANAFLTEAIDPQRFRPALREWIFAIAKLLIGIVCFWFMPRILPADWELVRGWTGMIGIAFLLHFGLFHLLSCFWRANGIEAQPLMDWPIASTSVTEFWGRRWNRAFRDLTHRFLFQPLTRHIGARNGLIAGFLFSGLIHELAITVPAHGGYGGPTLFFGLQAAAILIERTAVGRRIGLGKGWVGWTYTVLVLLVPAGLLFPRPFIHTIILPFLTALGG